jgi:predicted dehydrogenase
MNSTTDELHIQNVRLVNVIAAEMDDFAQCIMNHQPTRVPGEEGQRDVKIMMAIYEAVRTGKTASLA